jgi:hypothetical protein
VLKVKFDGLAGLQHLDNLVRTQDLTGHPGHQWVSTTQMFHVKHLWVADRHLPSSKM